MLLARPGELLTREEISRELWPDGTFVDYEHGVNSAVNRIREALGDTAASPRFVETLARHGYRFVAPVERICATESPSTESPTHHPRRRSFTRCRRIRAARIPQESQPHRARNHAAHHRSWPRRGPAQNPLPVVQTLFVLFQLMYLAFYVGALANLAEIQDLLSPLPMATPCSTSSSSRPRSLIPRAPSCSPPRSSIRRGFEKNSSSFGCVCSSSTSLVALALPAPAPYQHGPGAGLHHASRLFALCSALARSYGRRQREPQSLSNAPLTAGPCP